MFKSKNNTPEDEWSKVAATVANEARQYTHPLATYPAASAARTQRAEGVARWEAAQVQAA